MGILQNFPLMAALSAICFAQFIKVPIQFLLRRKTNWSLLTSTGGMPSSHSAAVCALITALVIDYGPASPYVAVAVTFGLLIMFDAMGVRRSSGEQGIVLNQLISEFQDFVDSAKGAAGETSTPRKIKYIKEMLGHKPLEVIIGAGTGVGVALVLNFLYLRFHWK